MVNYTKPRKDNSWEDVQVPARRRETAIDDIAIRLFAAGALPKGTNIRKYASHPYVKLLAKENPFRSY